MNDIELASETRQASRDHWRAAVAKVLKGGDVESLVTHRVDGSTLQPLYTGDDVATGGDESGWPGEAPLIRGGRSLPLPTWDIRAVVATGSPAVANAAVLEALGGGATSIELAVSTQPGANAVGIRSADDLRAALDGVLFDVAPVAVRGGVVAARWFADLVRDLSPVGGSFGLDPVGTLLATGRLPTSLDSAVAAGVDLAMEFPALTAFVASGVPASNAGASEAQEIAMALASGVTYLRALSNAGGSASSIHFEVTADVDVFATIAKLRALRHCWSTVLDAAGARQAMTVHAVSAPRHLTLVDPWVNLLRGTAATLGAVVGGADIVSVAPFHAGPLGRRMARNTQLILQAESGIGRVADPAGGSWYVESLTDDIARRAWSIVQQIDISGGLPGFDLDGLIAPVRAERARRVATRRQPITGVSEFALLGERRPDAVDVTSDARPGVDEGDGTPAAEATPLPFVRLSAPYEDLRSRTEPSPVFLANLGPASVYTARSTFAANLFAAGGVPTVADGGHSDPEAVATAFAASGCRWACLCSNDTTYAEIGAAVASALRGAGAEVVYLAGSFEVDGVDENISSGIDVIAILSALHEVSS